MHPFCAGDLVICTHDEPRSDHGPKEGEPWIRKGRAYRVKTILQVIQSDMPIPGIELIELPASSSHDGWGAWRFRKIKRAEDHFIATMQAVQANMSFKETVQKTVLSHRRIWAAPGDFKEGRAKHVTQLLTDYGQWFRGVFECYPDAAHIRIIAARMFTWRTDRPGWSNTMNPWVRRADYPALCRAALPVCLPGIDGHNYA